MLTIFKNYWEFISFRGLDWREARLEDVGEFVAWLQLPPAGRAGEVAVLPSPAAEVTAATVNRKIGRGATALLGKDPGRQVWGLGRHHVGSNFFWYFKDPAGNFSEYYSDMDCILDDALWKAGDWTDSRALFS